MTPILATAGWAIPRDVAGAFPGEGSGLQRYAGVLDGVEINTTFHRPHRAQTFERWAAAVPDGFRFAVKLPKTITHEARLVGAEAQIAAFLALLAPLGAKLGPILVQLPPSLAFDLGFEPVFAALQAASPGPVACEPRHASWFEPEVDRWLAERRIARVAADPARHPRAGEPGGWRGLTYHRLHGSPRMYYSAYSPDALEALAERLATDPAQAVWCVFDNTASGAAARDALALKEMLTSR